MNDPPPIPPDPVIEAYKKDIDRSLLRENLKLTPEQRIRKLMELQRVAEELQRAGKAAKEVKISGQKTSTLYNEARIPMKVVIQFSKREETRALPILLRHSVGMVLRDRKYIISEDAARALTEANIKFTELSRETSAPGVEEAVSGERI